MMTLFDVCSETQGHLTYTVVAFYPQGHTSAHHGKGFGRALMTHATRAVTTPARARHEVMPG